MNIGPLIRKTGMVGGYLLLLVSMLSACSGRVGGVVATPTQPPTLAATQTSSPTLTSLPPTAPHALPSPTRQATPRPAASPSGWTVYSNPDFVQGVALQGRELWAATLGGVVAWNLDTNLPTLYTPRDGLADIQGNDVVYCPAPDDRIFVAHALGILSVYDPTLKKWSRLPITFGDGTTFKSVQTLFCDSANRRLMVGSSDGLGIYEMETGRWSKIGPAEGLKATTIRAIDVVGQAIWVAAGDKSAFMIIGSTVFPFDSASGFPTGRVNSLAVAPDTSIWLGYSTGLVHYQDKKWNSYGAQTPAGIPFHSVDQVQIGLDKRIWIASATEGVCPFDPVRLFCASVYPGSADTPITDLVVGADGVAYVGTDGGGVVKLDGDQVQSLMFHQAQLVSNNVTDIAAGPDGRMWVATDRGVNILDPARPGDDWQTLTTANSHLAYAQVGGLFPSVSGMWFFYDQEPQVSFLAGENWLQLDANKGISDPVRSAAVDQRGYVWFASLQGIMAWDGSLMRAYTPPEDISAGEIHALLAIDDVMWVGAARGLLRYQHFQWKNILPDITVNTIVPDENGRLLLGTDQGLVRFDGDQSFLWLFNLGSEVVSEPKVTSIARDGNGDLWVGTAGQGLFHFNGSRWQRFNTATGLPTDQIRKIVTDRLGAVWIVTATGSGGGALVRFVP